VAQPEQAAVDQPEQAPADQVGPSAGPRVQTCLRTGPGHARLAVEGLQRWLIEGPRLVLSGCGGSCQP
jgi:hypothetical protein